MSFIKHSRLNKDLSQNELREYLENKDESSTKIITNLPPNYISFSKFKNKKIKVLLISPPISIPIGMQKRCIPPLGLSYIAAYLESQNIFVNIIDCCVEGYDQEVIDEEFCTYGLNNKSFKTKLNNLNYEPDIVGLSLLFSTDLDNLINISSIVKSTFKNCEIVVGGLHPTIYPKDIFKQDLILNKKRIIDWIIRGEGELRLYEFITDIQNNCINRNMDGLVGFLNSEFFCNYQRETIKDLNLIPFPAYHLLPIEKYFKINIPFSPVPQGNRIMQILTSRGCPISCSFCASTNMYKSYRHRSINNIMSEITLLKQKYNIDELQFADDNLTLNKSHSINFFNEFKKQNIQWCTPNGIMINALDKNLLNLMIDSGMYQITLSIDSANIRTLKELHHKPVDLERVPEFIKICRNRGVFTHGTIVVGMPGETLNEIKTSFDYILKNLHFTSINIFIAAAIPGSELYQKSLEYKHINKQDAFKINTTKSKILSTINKQELESLITNFQQYYFNFIKEKYPLKHALKYKNLNKNIFKLT